MAPDDDYHHDNDDYEYDDDTDEYEYADHHHATLVAFQVFLLQSHQGDQRGVRPWRKLSLFLLFCRTPENMRMMSLMTMMIYI